MKKAKNLSALILRQFLVSAALLLSAGCATDSQRSGEQALHAEVVRLKGQARWSSKDDKTWRGIKVGSKLLPGALVQTAMASRIDVRLGESAAPIPRAGSDKGMLYNSFRDPGNIMRVYENSLISFDRLAERRAREWKHHVEDVRFDLRAGRLFLHVKEMAADCKYGIKFPNGVIFIRDGNYDITADGYVKVLAGRASVTVAGSSKPQEVLGGQLFDARTGALGSIPDLDRSSLPR